MYLKKRFILFLSFLMFLVYGCYDELSLPANSNRDGGEFNISEAQKYFEENATDLSFIQITDSARIHSRGVSRKAELSPNWEKAVRTVGTEAVLVEVPLKSNAVLLESIRYFTDGKLTISKGCVSHVRLVMAQRTNGDVDMFVVTLVPSPRYPNSQEDLESFRYLGGSGNFTGKVFCSTLEGHFVEAAQYIGGRFFSKVNAIPRSRLEAMSYNLSDVSYESFIFTPGILSRSGTYNFDETDGSGSLMCEFHPWLSADDCPLCLDEVVVIACQRCGRRLEDGEICTCICSWCFQYPCKCCELCHTYPCIHTYPLCPVCHTDPCTKCTYCGLHYCYGKCRNTGSGGGGGSTTPSNPTPDPNPTPKDTIKHEQHIILLSDSLARKDLKNFTWSTQKGNTCVQTTMEMISRIIEPKKDVRIEEMIEYCQNELKKSYPGYTIDDDGTPYSVTKQAMENYFKNYIVNGTDSLTAFDYRKAIDNKNVIMTNIEVSSNNLHSILIIGYTKDSCFIYIDPNVKVFYYKCSENYLKKDFEGKYNFEIKINP